MPSIAIAMIIIILIIIILYSTFAISLDFRKI